MMMVLSHSLLFPSLLMRFIYEEYPKWLSRAPRRWLLQLCYTCWRTKFWAEAVDCVSLWDGLLWQRFFGGVWSWSDSWRYKRTASNGVYMSKSAPLYNFCSRSYETLFLDMAVSNLQVMVEYSTVPTYTDNAREIYFLFVRDSCSFASRSVFVDFLQICILQGVRPNIRSGFRAQQV